ncbi:phosphotransferase involved in threonylcarbamoyladenosine t(6)a37 formation in trna [hydrocarbon metagenome]|uniref:Phosphotransferase involved in threonylcarbamoyladenosine t(6)a37 formation in trna n=1 Tax=hydrocarbon metagenome TaxID=938273 RepID=A0A0W8FQJ0_9ZZZZ
MEIMQKEIQKFLTEHLGKADFKLEPIKKGGSDRQFFRVTLPHGDRFIFMHYGDEVAENAHWGGINKFMASLNMNVPRIITQDISKHFILIEDLGDVDLWSLRFEPWEERRDFYFQVLTQIYRLHSFDLKSAPADVQLSESYGPRLYKWEHDYFLENLVWEVCKIKLSSSDAAKLNKELDALSARLQKIEPSLIHRDFQSQNIMIKNGRPVMIDFQGMRLGCLFYDLGSLICDPYVTFEDEERNELINYYYELMNPSYSRDEFVHNFWMGSVQRLLQALGAYGFLGLKKHKTDFLGHIGNGLENLLIAVDNVGALEMLSELATECETILAGKNY